MLHDPGVQSSYRHHRLFEVVIDYQSVLERIRGVYGGRIPQYQWYYIHSDELLAEDLVPIEEQLFEGNSAIGDIEQKEGTVTLTGQRILCVRGAAKLSHIVELKREDRTLVCPLYQVGRWVDYPSSDLMVFLGEHHSKEVLEAVAAMRQSDRQSKIVPIRGQASA